MLAAAFLLAATTTPLLGSPEPEVRRYHYESAQTLNGAPNGGYRTEFRLVTSADGSIDAMIDTTGVVQASGAWIATEAPSDCRTRLNTPEDGVASVRLWPLFGKGEGPRRGVSRSLCAGRGILPPY